MDSSPVDPKMLKTEERIIRAALKVFASYPFDAVSFRMIAKEADVTLSLVAYYFKNKENLYKVVFNRVMESHEQTLQPFFDYLNRKGTLTPEEAEQFLRDQLNAVIEELYAVPLHNNLGKLIFLEYYYPSSSFDQFYERFFRRNYELMTKPIMALTENSDPRRAALIATNISGQFVSFRMEREFLVRYAKLEGFSREEIDELKEMVVENAFLMINAEREKNRRKVESQLQL